MWMVARQAPLVPGISQARILQWVAILLSGGGGGFPTQGLNPHLLHCKQILYRLSHQGPKMPDGVSMILDLETHFWCTSGRTSFFQKTTKTSQCSRAQPPPSLVAGLIHDDWIRVFIFKVSCVLPITASEVSVGSSFLHFMKLKLSLESDICQKFRVGTSLVVRWLRICLAIQGTWVRSLVQEDPIYCRATKSIWHNYWGPRAAARESVCRKVRACMMQPSATQPNKWIEKLW